MTKKGRPNDGVGRFEISPRIVSLYHHEHVNRLSSSLNSCARQRECSDSLAFVQWISASDSPVYTRTAYV